MHKRLEEDRRNIVGILGEAQRRAVAHVQGLEQDFVAPAFPGAEALQLPEEGLGAVKALDLFRDRYADYLLAMPGPNFFGFVIGGATPAALAADWLTSAYDQNAFGLSGNADRQIEQEACALAAELLGLGGSGYSGVMASGATMATFTALAAAREWAGEQQGLRISEDGLEGLKLRVYCGTAHASVYKALSMLGLGRKCMQKAALLPGREALDMDALESALAEGEGPAVVVGALCTVDSGDYDDLARLAALKRQYGFWLHIDGAIAAPAAVLPEMADRFAGLDAADSITLDCHKWFNTPYDAALTLTKEPRWQYRAFAQLGSADGDMPEDAAYFHLAPEGSRRLRALPLWASLLAYGRSGYADIFARNIGHAKLAYQMLEESGRFELLNEARFNIVCFTLPGADAQKVQAFAQKVRETGKTFVNTTVYRGETPALRLCFSNWSTEEHNVRQAVQAIIGCAE